MSRQCAWCRRGMDATPPLDEASVTHGICLDCAKKLLESSKEMLVGSSPEEYPIELPESV